MAVGLFMSHVYAGTFGFAAALECLYWAGSGVLGILAERNCYRSSSHHRRLLLPDPHDDDDDESKSSSYQPPDTIVRVMPSTSWASIPAVGGEGGRPDSTTMTMKSREPPDALLSWKVPRQSIAADTPVVSSSSPLQSYESVEDMDDIITLGEQEEEEVTEEMYGTNITARCHPYDDDEL